MPRFVLVSILSLFLLFALPVPQAGAGQYGPGTSPARATIAGLGNTGPLATTTDWWAWWAWLIYQLKKSLLGSDHVWNHTPRGSVPVPGTLLLFGAGFSGLVAWRAKNKRM